ncbi:MAG: hypothetical protein B6247_09880 [Candidatus Parabeggiatoa sp. nov. 2]|nr:MAG: hypothetical protein B6247_09880 [Beggiatoa sp. 4572_84]
MRKESKIYLGRQKKGTRLENNPRQLRAMLTLETDHIFFQKKRCLFQHPSKGQKGEWRITSEVKFAWYFFVSVL